MQGNPGYPPTLDLVLQGSGGGTGTQGATGQQGLQGATGTAGAAGAKGATGSAGPAGAPGATGPAGVAGTSGLPGIIGLPGPPGPTAPAVGLLLMATTTLTDAQVLALGTMPVAFVPSPGLGKVILPMAMGIYVPGASTYSASLSFTIVGHDIFTIGDRRCRRREPVTCRQGKLCLDSGRHIRRQRNFCGLTDQPANQLINLGLRRRSRDHRLVHTMEH
jgi:hypothetical protein